MQSCWGGMPFSPAVERSENLVSGPPKLLYLGKPQDCTALYIYIWGFSPAKSSLLPSLFVTVLLLIKEKQLVVAKLALLWARL